MNRAGFSSPGAAVSGRVFVHQGRSDERGGCGAVSGRGGCGVGVFVGFGDRMNSDGCGAGMVRRCTF
jgi:hypothetical protein